MTIRRKITAASKKLRKIIVLVFVTFLIDLIISVPHIFIFIDQSNVCLGLTSIVSSCIISYCGYRYLVSKTTAIFEHINVKKIGYIVLMLGITTILMNWVLPAIFGQTEDIGLNQQIVENMFHQGGIVSLLFKFDMVITAPIIEEIFYRGILFEEAKSLGKVVQFVWPTLVFAAIHSPSTPNQWTVYLTGGVLLMVIRLITKKLQYTVMFHMGHNLMSVMGL